MARADWAAEESSRARGAWDRSSWQRRGRFGEHTSGPATDQGWACLLTAMTRGEMAKNGWLQLKAERWSRGRRMQSGKGLLKFIAWEKNSAAASRALLRPRL